MKIILLTTVAAIALAGCGIKTNTYEYGICGYEETTGDPLEIVGKDGTVYQNEQAPLRTPIPCEPPIPPKNPECTVNCTYTPPECEDCNPVDPPEKVKGNNGWGNGDQDAPTKESEYNNYAENRGGNRYAKNEAPGRSWHQR